MEVKALTFSSEGRLNVLTCPVLVSEAALTTGQQTTAKQYNAIWDTGASASVITARVANDLGLKPIGMTEVHTAGGTRDCNIYLVDIELPNSIKITTVQVTEADMTTQDVLIGMDIIGLGDIAISNFMGKTTLSFRIPSVGKIDFVKDFQDQQQNANRLATVKQKASNIKAIRTKRKQERQAKKKNRKKK